MDRTVEDHVGSHDGDVVSESGLMMGRLVLKIKHLRFNDLMCPCVGQYVV